MLETEPNDTEPNGEERSGARSPQIDTAAGHTPAENPPATDDQVPAAKGRRRAARSPSRAKATKAPKAGEPSPDVTGAPAVPFAGPPAEPSAGAGAATGGAAAATAGAAAERSPIPAATFQPPQVIFQPPPEGQPGDAAARGRGTAEATGTEEAGQPAEHDDEANGQGRRRRRRGGRSRGHGDAEAAADSGEQAGQAGANGDRETPAKGGRETPAKGGREAPAKGGREAPDKGGQAAADANGADATEGGDAQAEEHEAGSRRRRRRRRSSAQDADQASPDEPANTVVHVRPGRSADESSGGVQPVRGSTRLEAKRQRRREGRDSGRRRPPIITESEFLARREAVDRVMVVRQRGERTQIGVLEDGVLVEHYVDKASHQSFVGNVYLGKVQNVLPSMEAAFVDIGKGRNAVLYAGEVNFDASGLEGESKRIESALKSGQSVLVQVTKDPVGHKGARLTSQVSLPGRYLVYVPGGSMMGISRKLPDKERTRLKQILKQVMPEGAGVIVRTAAEGASEEELAHDVSRLSAQWESIEAKAKSATAPALLYSEPDLTIRVVRDIFNEDFSKLVVSGDDGWDLVDEYVRYVAPHLADRLEHWQGDDDAFVYYRVDEQLSKALDRKVWLPSGGSLVIDNTEAMTVVDVNTGKFTGQGGNLEETVTRNNLEAAEEIVRQLRLRDVGGIIVIDFIDMVLESNRELVLRRLLECLARDRTKHQVAEVTSLGLVQMTRKRVGSGLLEAFSEPCECCNGRGVIVSLDLIDRPSGGRGRGDGRSAKETRQGRNGKNGKNGKESGRPVPEPAPAAAAGDGGAVDEAGPADAGSGAPGPDEAETAVAGPHDGETAVAGSDSGGSEDAGSDDAGADGRAESGEGPVWPSAERRRRGAVTREQGPPEPVGQQPHTEPPAAPLSEAQELVIPVPGVLTPTTGEPGPAALSGVGQSAVPGVLVPDSQEVDAPVPGGDGEVPAGDGEGGEAAGAAAAGSGPAGEPSAQPAETEFGAGSDNLAQDGSGVGGP
ncbi:MAG TPA: Rne/Rng family ribonuclease [Streptosporangiaceae bacterium]|nr:Rne/Rng family ribonuclease [Streptosporangiaceae bacterium]